MTGINQSVAGRPKSSSSAKAGAGHNGANVTGARASADIYETAEGVTLYVDLPGVSKDNLEIDVDQNVLTIKGQVNLDTSESMHPAYMDVRSKLYERRFTLGEQLDVENISATLNQGALKLFLPRREQHKPRKINVKTV